MTRTLRGRLTLAAVVAAALAIGVLTVTFNVVLERSLRDDVDSRLQARADAALATVEFGRGTITTRESPGDAALDAGVWIYDGTRAVERPVAAQALQDTADALAAGPTQATDAPGGETRLFARPIVRGGRRVGTVVAATSLAAYDRTTDVALIGSVLFAVALLVAVAGVAWLITGAALRPVREMTEQAADWSEHDLDGRFGGGERPDELGRLAATFDALLDRVAAGLRDEQRLSAELSHELRTPLAKVIAEADLLLRRPRSPEEQREGLEVIRRSAEGMTEILETLMAAARSQAAVAPGLSDLRAVAGRAAEQVSAAAAARGVRVDLPDGPPVTVGVDGAVAERVLGPLLDNAVRHARTTVSLDLRRGDGHAELDVLDDGPGVAAADRERIFEPGVTDRDGHAGAGLGLPLARRLARAAGGDVRAAEHEGGACFRVCLPAG